MSDYKGAGIWVPISDCDVEQVLKRGPTATYVIANWLRDKELYKHIKTSQVLYRLKQMEKTGLVTRVTGRRNPYSRQLMWELASAPVS